uniref:Uncharacterized protein n=1 Tax=viral metagenome TaxID=1070528 RepID=A0A6C0EP35_9ZZZZ
MKLEEIIGVTLNTGILAIFYTAIGGIVSYLLYYFVDEHNEEWEQRSTLYQVGDVSLQLAVIGTIIFWITYIIKEAPPIFHVSRELDALVDTYMSGVFFAYSMFLFIDFLDSKIKFLYHKAFDRHFEKMFPLRKTNKKKTT